MVSALFALALSIRSERPNAKGKHLRWLRPRSLWRLLSFPS